jgi:hypothetical protein
MGEAISIAVDEQERVRQRQVVEKPGVDINNLFAQDDPRLVQEIDVDGMLDRTDDRISYIGKATLQPNGKYRCLANVAGMLCLVEVSLRVPK